MQLNTDGSLYVRVDMCAYCQIDTGGNHEHWCPITTDDPITTITDGLLAWYRFPKSQDEMIYQCLNCGGLFSNKAEIPIAGKICDCGSRTKPFINHVCY